MKTQRRVTASPLWIEDRHMWRLAVQKDGKRKFFSSTKAGRAGKIACLEKAEEWLNASSCLSSRDPLVSDLFYEWIDSISEVVGTSTRSQNEAFGRIYIIPSIGEMRISQISNEQILQSIINNAYAHPANARGKHLSKKSLQSLRATISAFMKYARKCGLSTLIPEGLTIPRQAEVREKRILQPRDLRVLFTSITTTPLRGRGQERPEWFIHMFRFIVTTGIRPGEARGLQWKDITGGTVHIKRSINVHDEITRGKNDNARRTFVLPEIARRIINDQRHMLMTAAVTSDYIFCDVDGTPPREGKINKHLHAYCQHNDITQVTPYELRHTWFSLNKSLPAEFIKMMGGHSASMDTFGVYGHEIDGERERMAALVDSVMLEALEEDK